MRLVDANWIKKELMKEYKAVNPTVIHSHQTSIQYQKAECYSRSMSIVDQAPTEESISRETLEEIYDAASDCATLLHLYNMGNKIPYDCYSELFDLVAEIGVIANKALGGKKKKWNRI